MSMKYYQRVIVCATVALLTQCALAQPVFQVLYLEPTGYQSEVGAISADGTTVVGQVDYPSPGRPIAFRWTESTGMQSLETIPGALGSSAWAVSSNGSVVAGQVFLALGVDSAARWTTERGWYLLGDLPGGMFVSIARGVSGDGSVFVGTGQGALGDEAFRWIASTGPVGLGDLPGGIFHGEARAVSNDGSVVVGHSSTAFATEAFRWTASTGMVGLGVLPRSGGSSYALAVSADGAVVVGSSGNEAFRWTERDGMVGLGFLSGSTSAAMAVSADGSIVVGKGSLSAPADAFIWDAEHGMRSLKGLLADRNPQLAAVLSLWGLEAATGISADGGVIVGHGYGCNPIARPWIIRLGSTELPPSGDLNCSGTIDSIDLGILLSYWSIPPAAPACAGSSPCAADFNGDGVVNTLDLGILLANWTL